MWKDFGCSCVLNSVHRYPFYLHVHCIFGYIGTTQYILNYSAQYLINIYSVQCQQINIAWIVQWSVDNGKDGVAQEGFSIMG